ncbi:MAG: glycosyltransferase family 2 protein [Metamycoplasmataceae bacterium]
MSNKSFTVIIPSYNSSKTILSTIDSIASLDYDKTLIQILVIDDGSTDNIKPLIENNFKGILNIEYHMKTNGQWGSVINYVIKNKLARNDIISILDSDDFYTKNCFKLINEKIQNNDLFIGSFRKWDGSKKRLKQYPYYLLFKRKLTNKNQMNTPYCLPLIYFVKNQVFYKTKFLTEGIPCQDADYASQLVKNSQSLIFSPKTIGLYYYNREGNSISQSWDQRRMMNDYIACKKAIENNAQEIVSYRLNQKQFRRELDKSELKFVIERKFKFKAIPLIVRWIYWLIHFAVCQKYFIYEKNSQ